MEVKTYRARSLQQALRWIRSDLGPDASVLHTREIRSGLLRWINGRELEVIAGVGVPVPSRFEAAANPSAPLAETAPFTATSDHTGWPQPDTCVPPAHTEDYRERFRQCAIDDAENMPSVVEQLSRSAGDFRTRELSPELQHLYTLLIEADFDVATARELIEGVRVRSSSEDSYDLLVMKARLARLVEDQITCRGPIQLTPNRQHVVAVVGPTGVGKTTTIAKLAAHFHLRGRRRVGLITVDTYRIAAVDQLRTYADIIDLPMEVVSTPREMRAALAQLSDMDLVLMDTAGRSPGDELKIQELKSMLHEAHADEVHLVVSAVGSASSLRMITERFAPVGVTGLLLTKVDEATGLGHLLPLLRTCRLPLTYVTHGQDVPDDIEPADSRKLSHAILRMERGQ